MPEDSWNKGDEKNAEREHEMKITKTICWTVGIVIGIVSFFGSACEILTR